MITSTLKAFLTFLGSFFFSACLTVVIHEVGHALAFLILDYPDIDILVTPFYGITSSSQSLDLSNAAFVLVAGPFFDLFCATIIILSIWRKRSTKLLPILMYGGTAYLIEGVVMFNTFFTSSVLTDWDGIIYLGFPPFLVAVLSGIVLLIGIFIFYLIWPLVNISSEDTYIKKLIIGLGYIPYFIISFIYSIILNLLLLPELILLSFLNLIILVSITILMVLLYKPLFPLIDRISHTEVRDSSWSNVWLSTGSAGAIFLLLTLLFN